MIINMSPLGHVTFKNSNSRPRETNKKRNDFYVLKGET